MTKEELNREILHIDRVAAFQKKKAYMEYVCTNAKYKIGDIISDGTDTIRVERIDFNISPRGIITIFYYGPMLTKKGEPRKDGEQRAIYEDRLIMPKF